MSWDESNTFLTHAFSVEALDSFKQLPEEQQQETLSKIEAAITVRPRYDKYALFPDISEVESKAHSERLQNKATLEKMAKMIEAQKLKVENEFLRDIFVVAETKIYTAAGDYKKAGEKNAETESALNKLVGFLYLAPEECVAGPICGERLRVMAKAGIIEYALGDYKSSASNFKKTAALHPVPQTRLFLSALQAKATEKSGGKNESEKILSGVEQDLKDMEECDEKKQLETLLSVFRGKTDAAQAAKTFYPTLNDIDDYENQKANSLTAAGIGMKMLDGRNKSADKYIRASLLQLSTSYYESL